MKRNSLLPLALHTLIHIAGNLDRMLKSAGIAVHSGINTIVVRHVLGNLCRAGLINSKNSVLDGGELAKSAQDVTPADFYLALNENLIPMEEINGASLSVEHAFFKRMNGVIREIEKGFVVCLSETTLFEVLETE